MRTRALALRENHRRPGVARSVTGPSPRVRTRYKSVQAPPPHVTNPDRHHPTSPHATTRLHQDQPRYVSKRSKAQPHHALAGRADLRDGRAQESLQLGLGGQGVASCKSVIPAGPLRTWL
jgi:hypothetical protein